MQYGIDIEKIAKQRIFSGVPESKLPEVLSELKAKAVYSEKESVLFCEGDKISVVGVVLSGRVRMLKEDYNGNRSIITEIGEGQIFGEALCCTGAESLPISIVIADKSRVLLLDGSRLFSYSGNSCYFKIIENLLFIVAEKNLMLRKKITLLSKRTTAEKIMAFLNDESARAGSDSFNISFNRQQLADYLGVERSAMSAEIGKLKRAGKIHVERSFFQIIK